MRDHGKRAHVAGERQEILRPERRLRICVQQVAAPVREGQGQAGARPNLESRAHRKTVVKAQRPALLGRDHERGLARERIDEGHRLVGLSRLREAGEKKGKGRRWLVLIRDNPDPDAPRLRGQVTRKEAQQYAEANEAKHLHEETSLFGFFLQYAGLEEGKGNARRKIPVKSRLCSKQRRRSPPCQGCSVVLRRGQVRPYFQPSQLGPGSSIPRGTSPTPTTGPPSNSPATGDRRSTPASAKASGF